ncbi:MAG: biotin/lipoyl-binding protein, partial [Rhodoferax sp.]|nr:biotin/lipoyl-binding protein [Rhodoferax sp.]
ANSVAAYGFKLQCADAVRAVRVQPDLYGGVAVDIGGASAQAKVINFVDGVLRLELNGVAQTAIAVLAGADLHLAYAGHTHVFTEVSAFPHSDALKDASRARSPVAGKVTQVLVAQGAAVQNGQQLVCVEAMKMEMWLCAESAGAVKAVHAKAGDQVESGALLVELETKKDT